MGRKKGGDERRMQIVGALMRVMAARGYERASVATIADEAGIAPGLVHYYFKKKEDILLALMEQLSGHLRSRYERRLKGSDDTSWARLDAFIESYVGVSAPAHGGDAGVEEAASFAFAITDDDPAAVRCWVVIGAEALHLPAVCDVYESIMRDSLERLKLHLVEILATEGRQTGEVHVMAAGLMSAIEGAYKLGVTSQGLVPPGFAAPTIKQMARGLVDAQAHRQGSPSGPEGGSS